MTPDDEAGSAMVETFFLAVLLLVPLSWILVAAFDVQTTAYAAASAAREAARAYVTAQGEDPASARARADSAAALVFGDFQVPYSGDMLSVRGTLRPGSFVTVEVTTSTGLPFLPRFLAHHAVGVSGSATAAVDEFG